MFDDGVFGLETAVFARRFFDQRKNQFFPFAPCLKARERFGSVSFFAHLYGIGYMLGMGPLFRFVGLSIKSKPVAACIALLLMAAGVNLQEIAARLVTDSRLVAWATQWWIPWVFAFCAFWVLAYVFWRQSEAERASQPRADMDLRRAVDYVRVRSKWAVGRIYSANENHLLEEDIDGIIRDAAVQGRVTIWGRPELTDVEALISQPLEIQIPASEWPNLGFDLTTLVHDDAPNGVCTWDIRNTGRRFCRLRVNREQIYREWPPALYGRLFLDKTWKSRKLRTA